MRNIRSIRAALIAVVVAVPLLTGLSPAAADPVVTPFQIPRVWRTGLLTGCTVLCADSPYATTGKQPGVVEFSAPYPYPGPSVYRVQWNNLSTGSAGVAAVGGSGPTAVLTGPGVVTASFTAGNEYFGANGIFYVP